MSFFTSYSWLFLALLVTWIRYQEIIICIVDIKSNGIFIYLFLKLMHTLVHILHFVSRRKLPICCKSLTKFITSVFVEYTLSWAGFELASLVVIDTDCTGSCKPNYHTITKTTAPNDKEINNYWNRLETGRVLWFPPPMKLTATI
jgi:hypothetical protein